MTVSDSHHNIIQSWCVLGERVSLVFGFAANAWFLLWELSNLERQIVFLSLQHMKIAEGLGQRPKRTALYVFKRSPEFGHAIALYWPTVVLPAFSKSTLTVTPMFASS